MRPPVFILLAILVRNCYLIERDMTNPETLNLVIGGVAIVLLVSAFLMMFTSVFTTKEK